MTQPTMPGRRRAAPLRAPRAAAAGAPRPSRAAWPAMALAVIALGGCTLQGERPLALSQPQPESRPAAASPATRVKTVRATARPGDDGDETVPSVAGVPVAALPTPRQIFDFHPAGAPADAWRQPFVIDVNDGPLAADVRRSAAELKAFLATSRGETRVGLRPVGAPRCGETDVATAKPGCAAAGASRPPARAAAPTPPTP